MLRTQISLPSEERQNLDDVAGRTGRSISALIRDAVKTVESTRRSSDEDILTMRRGFGSWPGGELDGQAWVDELCSGSRLSGPGS
ncbi:MAG: ribbon-helix-helix protein, CopG family [Acidimicrobiales bacterium]